jgi:hypothetical protein
LSAGMGVEAKLQLFFTSFDWGQMLECTKTEAKVAAQAINFANVATAIKLPSGEELGRRSPSTKEKSLGRERGLCPKLPNEHMGPYM